MPTPQSPTQDVPPRKILKIIRVPSLSIQAAGAVLPDAPPQSPINTYGGATDDCSGISDEMLIEDTTLGDLENTEQLTVDISCSEQQQMNLSAPAFIPSVQVAGQALQGNGEDTTIKSDRLDSIH